MAAVLAALHMAAERGGAALLDGRHDLELTEAQVPGLRRRQAGPWSRKMSATSKPCLGIAAPAQAGGRGPKCRRSSGPVTSRRVRVATWL